METREGIELLHASTAEVRIWCARRGASWGTALSSVTPAAVAGDRLAIRSYATAYVELVDHLTAEFGASRIARTSALREAVTAPVRARGSGDMKPGEAICVYLIDALRAILHAEPLDLPDSWEPVLDARDLDEASFDTFDRLTDALIDRQVGEADLDFVAGVLDLTEAELGFLFGVSRQAVGQWRERGVPSAKRGKLSAVAGTCELLSHHLRRERIPGVARRPADAYGGRTMLEMIRDDDHEELLEMTRESFDFSRTA